VIERENVAFSEKHGMSVGSREYVLCTEDLMDIRAKQDQRAAEDIQRTLIIGKLLWLTGANRLCRAR
jgi:hypothetical protein